MNDAARLARDAVLGADQMREHDYVLTPHHVTAVALASIAASLSNPPAAPYDPHHGQLGDVMASGDARYVCAPISDDDPDRWYCASGDGVSSDGGYRWYSADELPAGTVLVSRSTPVDPQSAAPASAPAIVLDDADDEGPVGP